MWSAFYVKLLYTKIKEAHKETALHKQYESSQETALYKN